MLGAPTKIVTHPKNRRSFTEVLRDEKVRWLVPRMPSLRKRQRQSSMCEPCTAIPAMNDADTDKPLRALRVLDGLSGAHGAAEPFVLALARRDGLAGGWIGGGCGARL